MEMKLEKLKLHDFAGQNCDVEITGRKNGSIFVRFESMEGYGNPILELEQLESLVKRCKMMEDARK